jgi:hypothetical protein
MFKYKVIYILTQLRRKLFVNIVISKVQKFILSLGDNYKMDIGGNFFNKNNFFLPQFILKITMNLK